MLGTVIGNFRVVSLLGRGGMGEVYVAEHVGIQTRVAIKVLLPEISKHEGHVTRLFNEARIVSRIKHAGIAKIFDVGFHDGQAYLVMEFLEGEPLSARIARGRMSVGEVADVGRQIASVLAATHAEGVTHRDLKPDNIFIVGDAERERGERVKVLDFGIAKLPGSAGPRTIGTMGTPEYMAPEQWGDSGSVDWRADAYSLGCVLFEMMAGRPPFPSATIVEAYTQHTQSVAPQLRTLVPDVPIEIERLVDQLLAKSPAARGESMQAIARALEPWASSTATPMFGVPIVPPPRMPTTLGGGAGQVVRGESVKRTGFIAGGLAVAAIVAIALVSGRGTSRAASGPPRTLAAPTVTAPVAAPPAELTPVVAPKAEPPSVAVPKAEPTAVAAPKAQPTPVAAPKTEATPVPTKRAPHAASSAKPTTPSAKPAASQPTMSAPAVVPVAPHDELEGRT